MSYLGNKNGPKESEIIEKLGPEYFGITWEQLHNDILYYKDAERRGEIVPVRIDKNNNIYILLSSADINKQHYYLLKEGYKINGKIIVLKEDGNKMVMEID